MSSNSAGPARLVPREHATDTPAWVWPSTGGHPEARPDMVWPPQEASAPAARGADPAETEDWERLVAEARTETELLRREMAQAVDRARQQGFAEGRAQGEQAGQDSAAALVEPVMARLLRTIEDLSATRDTFRREAEEDIVRLALGIARRIVHREVTIDGSVLLGVIRAALDKIGARELHRVLVCPEDQPSIAAGLESLRLGRRIEVAADQNLERGAVLFETVKGSLDASLETQLDEIERGLIDALDRRGTR